MPKNPIPPDQSIGSRGNELSERNRAILKNILEKSSSTSRKRTDVEQKIGDFYASCMDEQTIEKLGAQPLQADLDSIQEMKAKSAIRGELVRLHLLGVNAFFNFSSGPDAKDSMKMIGQADQGGLSLADRGYYLKDDAKAEDLRKQYLALVTSMLKFLGESAENAAADATAVLRLDTG